MSGRLENNGTLLNALHDNKPFVYAHLVKFERPVNSLAAASDNTSRELDATKFAYLTDGAFDIVFDDESTYKNTSDVVTSNGPQTYIANKLVSLGSFSESTDLKVTSTSLTFDATTIDATLNDSFAVAVNGSDITITASNSSFSEEGFREGDTFKFSSGSNSGNTYRIDAVYNAGKTVSVTDTTLGTTTAHSSTPLTINIESQEINGLLHSTAENKISFINRRVFIYKAFFYADAPHTFIGTPILLFKGTVTSAGFEEDPEKGAKITWSISNFLADYRRVKGRITSHEAHQGYTNEGGVKGENAIRPEYALDRGFEYSEKSLSLLATYADTEKETRTKKKKIFFGLFGSIDEPYQVDVPVTREVDLRFDLQAKYIPVVYGVQRVKGIPVFADLSAQLTSSKETEVFVSHAISEGPIQSILNVYVDDNALVCMSLADAKSRDPSNPSSTAAEVEEANNADIQCIGRADSGQVLEGSVLSASSLAYQAAQNIYNPREVQISEGYETFSQSGGSGSSSNLSYSYGSLGFTAGETGLTHEKNLQFDTPVTSTLEAHMGLSNQKASNMLVTQARTGQFKIQAQKSISNYYTSEHQLLDTAYVAGRYIIGREQTTIPSLDFVVKGKMIQAYNYDGSYKHSTLSSYSSEDHSNFKPGDSVSLHSSVSFTSSTGTSYSPAGPLLSGKEILDKFFFFDHNGVKQYRFRWDLTAEEQTLLGEAKRFYMVNGSNQWHMVTYDAPDVPDSDLTTVVTVAEVLTADLTQTSTGSDSFEATMSNISASATADYTTTDAELMLYVPEDDFADGLSPFGVNSFAKRTPVLRGNIANITGGTAIQVNNTTSTESIPSGTKVVVTNQVKLSSNASTVDDIYNGQKIIFTRLLSAAQARISGVDRVRIERTVLDYNGSSRLITLDNDVSQGLLQVGDTVTLVGETSDRPFIEEDVNKAGDLRPSTNFALITLDYLKSKRYGLQLEDQDLNLNDFLLAAVECDTQSDVSVNCMFTTPGAHFTVKAGDVYEYKDSVTGHLKWRGTVVEDRDSTGPLGQNVITFTNVYGKLTNKWNDYTYREVGDLIYDDAPGSPVGLQVITSAGVQSTSVTDNSTANVDTAITKVSGDSSSAASITLTVGQGHRNPVTSYSLYDSDSITYWKYLGWEEHTQRYVTRHQGNITIDTSKPQLENLKGLLSHFNAYLYPSEGKLRLRIEAARAATGEESDANFNDSNTDVDVKVRYITDDDIIGKINLKDEGLSKAYNSVSASISDPMLNFDDRSVTFIDSTYKKQDNGIVKSANFSMPGITNYYNARIAAKQTLDRSRFSRQISFTMRPSGMSILPGQLIRINYSRFGWGTGSEVLFRVRTVSISKDCLVSITASEYNDSVYVINKNIVSPFFIDEPIAQVSRTPGAPGNVSVTSATTSSQNIVTWTAAAGISEETGQYEIWRATSFSGDAGISVTTHATLIGEVSSEELSFPDINTTTTTTQNFIYWVRAYNQSQPQTTSGIKKGTKKYYGPFNDDSDYGGVGQGAAAQAVLKALEESLSIKFSKGSTVSVPSDEDGIINTYNPANGSIIVEIANTDITSQCTFSVSNQVNISLSTSGANYTLSNMTADTASADITANVPANSTTGLSVATTVTAKITFNKSKEGKKARTAVLSGLSFQYDENGANPTPSSGVITAIADGTSGTVYYEFLLNGSSVQNTTSNTYTYTPQASYSNMTGELVQVNVREGSIASTILARGAMVPVAEKQGANGLDGTDGVDGVDGVDAYTVRGSNESHTFVADTTGAASMTSFACDFTVFKGAQAYTYDGSSPYAANSFRYGTIVATNVTQSVSGTGQITLQSGSAIATGLSIVTGSLSVPIIDNATGTTVALPLISFSKSIQAARDGGVFIFEESTNSNITSTVAASFAEWTGQASTSFTNSAAQAVASAVITASSDGHIRPNDRVTVTDNSNNVAGTRIYTGTGTTSSSSVSTSDFSTLVTEVFDGSVIVDGTLSADKLLANTTTTNTLNIGSDLIVANNGKIHSVNKTGYSDTDAGFFLGWNGSNHVVNIGNATNFLKWNGTNVLISGNISFTNAPNISTFTNDSGFTDDTAANAAQSTANTGVTNAAAAQSTADSASTAASNAQGTANTANNRAQNFDTSGDIFQGINVGTGGHIRGGQSAFNNGVGFFLGYSGSAYKFSIGNSSGQGLTWDGTNLSVVGSITIQNASNINLSAFNNDSNFTDDTAANAAQATANSAATAASNAQATADSKLSSSDVTQSFIEGKITDAASFRSDIAAYASSNPSGFTTFAAGDVQNAITNNVTTIDGSKINTGTLNAANVNVINLNASNISSGTISTARLNVSDIISTGSIIVSGDNITSLTNNAGFTDDTAANAAQATADSKVAPGEVNANVTSISGGAITTGTVSANRIDVGSIVIGNLSGASTFKGALTNINNPTSAITPISGGQVNANVTSISGGVITTGTVAAARVDVSGIITAGSIIVSGDNITSLTNNAGFTDDTAADAAQATADSKVAPSEVNGNVTSISGGVISTGVINLGNASGMAIRQGKTGYSSTTNGFWLGNDGGTPKFHIGDASDFMRWTGSQLEISGIITAQAGSTIAAFKVTYPPITHVRVGGSGTISITSSSIGYGSPSYVNGSGNYSYSWSKLVDVDESNGGGTVTLTGSSTVEKPSFQVTGMGTNDHALSIFEVVVTDTTSGAVSEDTVYVSIITEGT